MRALLNPGDPGAVQQAILDISRFMQTPPGVVRVQYDDGTAEATLQVCNRVGQANTGFWLLIFFRIDNADAQSDLAPTPTAGRLLETWPSSTTYLGMTDASGKMVFTCGLPLASGDKLYAFCLGELAVLAQP